MATTIKTRIKNKINLQSKWSTELSDYVLLSGELAVAKTQDNFKMKIGDGTSKWSQLPNFSETVNISETAYQQLVNSNSVDPDLLYIVSSDSINAFDQKIINLSQGTNDTDAVNLHQLNERIEPCIKKSDDDSLSISLSGGLSSFSINDDNFIQCVLSAVQLMNEDQLSALKERLGLNS